MGTGTFCPSSTPESKNHGAILSDSPLNSHGSSALPAGLLFFCKDLEVSEKVFTFAADMKKEFGKWLMDIAKYMVTALLLATIFADMEEPIIVYMVVFLSIVVLIIGLVLVDDNKPDNKNKKGKKK